jgi:hypothetical protein
MTSRFKKQGDFVITNDGSFAIHPEQEVGFVSFTQRDSIGLYIRDGLELDDSPLKQLINSGFIVGDTRRKKLNDIYYRRYTFFRPLVDKRKYLGYHQPVENDKKINENDCLKFAESISVASTTLKKTIFNKLIRSNSSPCVYHVNKTLFGDTDAKNMSILSKVTTINNAVFPLVGEAYAIVRKKLVLESAPYHIAFVLYSHNGVNITIEANADDGPEYYPRFGFYDMKNTFHKLFIELYDNGTTIVLQSRPIDDFLEEFEKDV